MPASGAVDGGLCAVGAGGEVERGVGRYSSAIYGKEEGMELQEVKQKLSELENRIATREKEMEEDRVLIRYLQGYVAGVDSLLNQN